jgi:hypothetical protein
MRDGERFFMWLLFLMMALALLGAASFLTSLF